MKTSERKRRGGIVVKGRCPRCGAKGSLVEDVDGYIACLNCGVILGNKKALEKTRKIKKEEWEGQGNLFRKMKERVI